MSFLLHAQLRGVPALCTADVYQDTLVVGSANMIQAWDLSDLNQPTVTHQVEFIEYQVCKLVIVRNIVLVFYYKGANLCRSLYTLDLVLLRELGPYKVNASLLDVMACQERQEIFTSDSLGGITVAVLRGASRYQQTSKYSCAIRKHAKLKNVVYTSMVELRSKKLIAAITGGNKIHIMDSVSVEFKFEINVGCGSIARMQYIQSQNKLLLMLDDSSICVLVQSITKHAKISVLDNLMRNENPIAMCAMLPDTSSCGRVLCINTQSQFSLLDVEKEKVSEINFGAKKLCQNSTKKGYLFTIKQNRNSSIIHIGDNTVSIIQAFTESNFTSQNLKQIIVCNPGDLALCLDSTLRNLFAYTMQVPFQLQCELLKPSKQLVIPNSKVLFLDYEPISKYCSILWALGMIDIFSMTGNHFRRISLPDTKRSVSSMLTMSTKLGIVVTIAYESGSFETWLLSKYEQHYIPNSCTSNDRINIMLHPRIHSGLCWMVCIPTIGTITIWELTQDVTMTKCTWNLRGCLNSTLQVTSAVLHDEWHILLGSTSGEIELWKLPFGVGKIATSKRHTSRVSLHGSSISHINLISGLAKHTSIFVSSATDNSILIWYITASLAMIPLKQLFFNVMPEYTTVYKGNSENFVILTILESQLFQVATVPICRDATYFSMNAKFQASKSKLSSPVSQIKEYCFSNSAGVIVASADKKKELVKAVEQGDDEINESRENRKFRLMQPLPTLEIQSDEVAAATSLTFDSWDALNKAARENANSYEADQDKVLDRVANEDHIGLQQYSRLNLSRPTSTPSFPKQVSPYVPRRTKEEGQHLRQQSKHIVNVHFFGKVPRELRTTELIASSTLNDEISNRFSPETLEYFAKPNETSCDQNNETNSSTRRTSKTATSDAVVVLPRVLETIEIAETHTVAELMEKQNQAEIESSLRNRSIIKAAIKCGIVPPMLHQQVNSEAWETYSKWFFTHKIRDMFIKQELRQCYQNDKTRREAIVALFGKDSTEVEISFPNFESWYRRRILLADSEMENVCNTTEVLCRVDFLKNMLTAANASVCTIEEPSQELWDEPEARKKWYFSYLKLYTDVFDNLSSHANERRETLLIEESEGAHTNSTSSRQRKSTRKSQRKGKAKSIISDDVGAKMATSDMPTRTRDESQSARLDRRASRKNRRKSSAKAHRKSSKLGSRKQSKKHTTNKQGMPTSSEAMNADLSSDSDIASIDGSLSFSSSFDESDLSLSSSFDENDGEFAERESCNRKGTHSRNSSVHPEAGNLKNSEQPRRKSKMYFVNMDNAISQMRASRWKHGSGIQNGDEFQDAIIAAKVERDRQIQLDIEEELFREAEEIKQQQEEHRLQEESRRLKNRSRRYLEADRILERKNELLKLRKLKQEQKLEAIESELMILEDYSVAIPRLVKTKAPTVSSEPNLNENLVNPNEALLDSRCEDSIYFWDDNKTDLPNVPHEPFEPYFSTQDHSLLSYDMQITRNIKKRALSYGVKSHADAIVLSTPKKEQYNAKQTTKFAMLLQLPRRKHVSSSKHPSST